jgi:hypothetical protein
MAEVIASGDNTIFKTTFTDREHKPSWKNYGNTGFAEIEFQTHKDQKYLSIRAQEIDTENNYSKVVYITLDKAQAAELLKQLNIMFWPEAK